MLVSNPGGASLTAQWRTPDPDVDKIYHNQCNLTFREFTYDVIKQPMVFQGFKYAPPSYITLSGDKKTFTITSEGNYLIMYTVTTFDIETASEFQLYQDGGNIPSSISSFVPSRGLPTDFAYSIETCTSFCIVEVSEGDGIFQLKISPTSQNTINNDGSVLTVIKLSNFEP